MPSAVRIGKKDKEFAEINYGLTVSWGYAQSDLLHPLSPLKGDSPVRGNVSEADKGVPVFGEKDVCGTQTEGLMKSEQAILKGFCRLGQNPSVTS